MILTKQVGGIDVLHIYRLFNLINLFTQNFIKIILQKTYSNLKIYFHGENIMKIKKKNMINRLSENSLIEFLKEKGIMDDNFSLKFLTLSIGYVESQKLDWGLELAIRSVNNFLDRYFTKKSIRHSLSVKSDNRRSEYLKKSLLQSLHGKRVNDIISGGIYKVEFEDNPEYPRMFNLHVHILCQSDYIPQSLISFLWRDVLSKPFQGREISSKGIVDIRDIKNTEQDIRNRFRYLVKPVPAVRNERFKYSRLLSRFGTWYNA